MSFTNYESQKKLQEIQRSILKTKFAIEKKSKANTLEILLGVESELQFCLANTMNCVNLVNSGVQSDSIQNCLLPHTVGHLKLCRKDAHLFKELFGNCVFIVELLESIQHICTKSCTFNPMEDVKIIPINDVRKMYIQYFKLLKVSRILRKSLLMLMKGSVDNTFERTDDLEMKTSDSTICSFHGDAVYTSSPILKEKNDQKGKKHAIEF